MPCHPIIEKHGEKLYRVGFFCTTPSYKYRGFLFEWHSYCGPSPLRKKTFELRSTIPTGFWAAMDDFQKLSEEERQPFLVECGA